jgi:2-hydroxy-3-oxopropionate reductase
VEQIGFIGLGIMGKPMARNLLRAGFPLTVYTRNQATVAEFVEQGAKGARNPREVAEQSTVVITMLPDSPEVQEVALGPNGVIEGIMPGSLFIDMSTIDPAVARAVHAAFAERQVEALDAPVSGGQIGAEQGTLSIMVGGSEAAFERARPIFQVLGKNITHVGGPGAGQVAKACNQMVVALTIQAVAEALTLAARAGVDPARVRQALLGGFAHSRILEVHGQRMLENTFTPGFRARLHRKDLRIALNLGREFATPLPATAHVATLFDSLIAHGGAELDHAALALVYRVLAGEGTTATERSATA